MTKRFTTSLVVLWAATACTKPGNLGSNRQSESKLVSVKMKMPTKIGDKDVTGKMDGYALSIKKTAGDCAFSDVDRMEKVAAGDVKIDAALKQGCNYSIVLSFGKSSADGKKLDQIYLTSDAHDGKPALPTLIKKEDLQGKTAMTVKACVNVTELGAKELGVNVASCPSISDDSIETTIDPVVAQLNTTFKLTKSPTASITGQNLVITAGELTSVATATKFCAVAVETKFMGTAKKRVMLEDAILEIKPGDKKSIEKTIDIKEIVEAGPNSIAEITVIETCQDAKPVSTITALSMIDACTAANSCSPVKP